MIGSDGPTMNASSAVESSMNMFGQTETLESQEIELHGVLQKRNRNGVFQTRYFRTEGHNLCYWWSIADFENHRITPSSKYDIREIQYINIQPDGKTLYSQFMNEKFKVEIRAISENQAQKWFDFLSAKKELHSISTIIHRINDGVKFRTCLFQTLLPLKEVDQVRFCLLLCLFTP